MLNDLLDQKFDENKEMDKLIAYVYKKYADNDDVKVVVRFHRGPQVRVCDKNDELLWDGVCNAASYGHEHGLIEVMEHTDKNYVLTEEERNCDDVLGWLTAQDIIDRLEGKSSE